MRVVERHNAIITRPSPILLLRGLVLAQNTECFPSGVHVIALRHEMAIRHFKHGRVLLVRPRHDVGVLVRETQVAEGAVGVPRVTGPCDQAKSATVRISVVGFRLMCTSGMVRLM